MILLMIINTLLYYKLRNIEIIALSLKNNPDFLAKYNDHI